MESEGYGGEIEHVAIDLDSVDSLREQPLWVIKQLPIQWWMRASYS
jgi:hypothetical protein